MHSTGWPKGYTPMDNPIVPQNQTGISLPQRLGFLRASLAEASDDFARTQVRDFARAVKEAAVILNYQDIVIQASELIQDAERTIDKATPPQQGKRTDIDNFVIRDHEVDEQPVSPDTRRQIRRAHNISDEEYEQVKEEYREKQEPITRAALIRKGKEKRNAENAAVREILTAEPVPIPDGLFDVIYADPPWAFDQSIATTPGRDVLAHYPTMTTDDICRMEIPAADDAALFMWTPASHMPQALEAMYAWGFDYKTELIWVKPSIGMGHWLRLRHEPMLIGIRGTMPIDKSVSRESVVEAPRGKHSEKPVEVYELIERMFPGRRYLELFSRKQRERWEGYGYEFPA